ncbi:hypothetical protein MTO96_039501 [Rhipicephalus appendiculatus]
MRLFYVFCPASAFDKVLVAVSVRLNFEVINLAHSWQPLPVGHDRRPRPNQAQLSRGRPGMALVLGTGQPRRVPAVVTQRRRHCSWHGGSTVIGRCPSYTGPRWLWCVRQRLNRAKLLAMAALVVENPTSIAVRQRDFSPIDCSVNPSYLSCVLCLFVPASRQSNFQSGLA